MRPVTHGDVAAVACVLYALPAAARPRALAEVFARAEAADAYRRATGRGHPRWGNGSLTDACQGRPFRHEPALETPDFAACMAMVYLALADPGTLDKAARGADIASHVAAPGIPR